MRPVAKKIIIGTAVLAIILLYFLLNVRSVFFPKCPFYLFLHCYCPGCGSQRALSSLLHGHVLEALHNNILMVLFLPLLLYWLFVNVLFDNGKHVPVFYNVFFARTVLIMVVCFWILRNIPFYPFSILAPLN